MINEEKLDIRKTGVAGLLLVIFFYFVVSNILYNIFIIFYELIYTQEYVSLRNDNGFDLVENFLKASVTLIMVACFYFGSNQHCRFILGLQSVTLKNLFLSVSCIFIYLLFYDFFQYFFERTFISDLFIIERALEGETYKNFWAFFFVCLIIPACEEIFFRGYLISYLLDRMLNKHFCVVFSSMLFTAFHYNYSSPFLFEVFVVSSMIGYARIVSDSIYSCIIMHGAYNSVFFL